MLVLSRKVNECVVLTLPDGREIRVGPVRIGPNQMRLGIEAPLDISILRDELALAERDTETGS